MRTIVIDAFGDADVPRVRNLAAEAHRVLEREVVRYARMQASRLDVQNAYSGL